MATTISSNVLEEFSARVQTEGRKLAGRVRDDITAFVGRNPQVVLDDVRKRATAAAKELDAQRERIDRHRGEHERVGPGLRGDPTGNRRVHRMNTLNRVGRLEVGICR